MIYFVREELSGRVKIGYAADPAKRVAELATGSPGPLVLMGTVPGERQEEATLHAHFAQWRRHREWFEGHRDLLRGIGLLLVSQGTPTTVQDELGRRQGCRYGLKGVRVVTVWEPGRVFVIDHSVWDRRHNLDLDLAIVPEEEWEAWTHRHDHLAEPRTGRGFITICAGRVPIERALAGVNAADAVLLSDWPAPCPCWRDQS